MDKVTAKIKDFGNTYFKSASNIEFIGNIIHKPINYSVKYFLALSIIFSTIGAISFYLQDSKEIKASAVKFVEDLTKSYPEDLVITVKDGVVKVNQPEPFFIKTPKALRSQDEVFPENFLTFDSGGTIEDLEKYNTAYLINSKNVIGNVGGKMEVNATADIPDSKLNRQDFMTIIGRLNEFLNLIPILLAISVFIIYLITYLGINVLGFLAIASILKLFGNTLKTSTSFWNYFQIAIHAATLPLSVALLLTLLHINILPALVYFFANIGIALIAASNVTEREFIQKQG